MIEIANKSELTHFWWKRKAKNTLISVHHDASQFLNSKELIDCVLPDNIDLVKKSITFFAGIGPLVMTNGLPNKQFKDFRIGYALFNLLALSMTIWALFSNDWAKLTYIDPKNTVPDKFGILPGYCYSETTPHVCETWKTERKKYGFTIVAVLVCLAIALQLFSFVYNLLLSFKVCRKRLRVELLAIAPIFACLAFFCGYLIFRQKKGTIPSGDDHINLGTNVLILFIIAHVASVISICVAFAEIRAVREQERVGEREMRQEQAGELRILY